MTRILIIVVFFLFVITPFCHCQDRDISTVNTVIQRNDLPEDTENQQINKDEGYGNNDLEYYGAEGVSSQNNLES